MRGDAREPPSPVPRLTDRWNRYPLPWHHLRSGPERNAFAANRLSRKPGRPRLNPIVAVMLAGIVAAPPLLTGCVTNPLLLPSAYTDKDDPCHNQRVALAGHRSYFAQDIVVGAALGLATGAVMSAAAALVQGGDVKKAARIGAVGGAVLGAIAGYYNARLVQEGKTPDLFFSRVLNDVNKENERIRAMNRSLESLLSCRRSEAREIRSALRSGKIDRATAEQRMSALRRRLDQDVELARSIRKDLGERANSLQVAGVKVSRGRIRFVDLGPDDTDAASGSGVFALTSVNVRAGPGTNHRVVGSLSPGEKVKVVGRSGGWSEIRRSGGGSGFVASRYLGDKKSVGTRRSGGSKKRKSGASSDTRHAIAQLEPAPKPTNREERKVCARIEQSTSQLQDNVLSSDRLAGNLEQLADEGLELEPT